MMKLEGEQTLLRAYLRNTDKHGLQTAAEAIVEHAKTEGLSGATLLRGIAGLDIAGQLLATHRWSLVEHVPVVVEIVDSPQRIGSFLPLIAQLIPEGIVTLERAHVLLYRHNAAGAAKSKGRLQAPSPVADLSTVPTAEDFPIMKLSEDGQLLRVFIGESDTWQGEPLFRAIVLKARELGLAGATVLHGSMGFGAASRVHTSRLLDVSTDLPIVVELVDSPDKIQSLLPFLDECVAEGMITIESVRVLKYRSQGA
jgi:PII-like signaling protein